MLKVFCAPARYTQGPDATLHLGPEIQNLGLEGPALIVAGRSAIRLLTPTWQSTFAQTNTQYEMFPFAGECTAAEVQRGVTAAQNIQAKIIIGAGGGKVLDAARTIADLDNADRVLAKHLAEAIQYRSLDRSYWG